MMIDRVLLLYCRAVMMAALVLLLAGCQRDEPQSNTDAGSAPNSLLEDTAVNPDESQVVAASTQHPEANALWGAARYATPGRIPASSQRPGDIEAGRKALLDKAYVSCGLPERVFRSLLDDENTLEAPDRSADAAGLPYGNTVSVDANGQRIVSNNCLTCHATPLFGELVIGLGNEFLDFTADASAFVERAGALVNGESEIDAWELYANRIAAIAPYTRMHTVGVNPANNLTFALIAHRHADTNAWSDTPLLALPPKDPPPVSVPPWWRMKKKTAMFNLGEGRGDHARIMMAASMLCTDNAEALAEIDQFAPDIRAFIASLDAPAWPFALDDSLAAEGKGIFEANCSQCHGTYGANGVYPARLVPLEVVQTDAALVNFAHSEQGASYIDWYNRSYYGEISTAAPGYGYVAPPLEGIWATAPFLHNGSVPTLRAVLDSSTRPELWQHTVTQANDKDAYDQKNLGWVVQVLTRDEVGAPKPAQIYDTRLPGYSNSGHRFGDHLSDDQRTALLEYLKSL